MTKKTWIVWTLFFVLPGIVGLCIHFVLNQSIDDRIAESAEKNHQDTAVTEYLQSYERWSDLSPDDKADNPWGFGEYGGSDIQKQLVRGQYDRLISDLPDLDKGVTHYPDSLADVVYGLDWHREVENYRQERLTAEVILIGAIFLLAVGVLILIAGVVKTLFIILFRKHEDDVVEEESSQEQEMETVSNANTMVHSSSENEQSPDSPTHDESEPEDTNQVDEGYFKTVKKTTPNLSSSTNDGPQTTLPMNPPTSVTPSIQKDSYFGWAIDADDSTDLETLMTTEPLTKELTELTEEVSAIRQFAAQQQDQMRKLQDGYDWMIIRRFCLRVIRCIDNIEDRIVNLQEQGQEVAVFLEDIRDELVFALESSGIEQFKPDLNIPFKGLEKYAEAVRERELTGDAALAGCIAQVTRPGYQYLVNDDDVKIVRCAQVKLYEAN